MPLQQQTKKMPKTNEVSPPEVKKTSSSQKAGAESGMTPAHILQLQRTVGNQAVQRMLAGAMTQQSTQTLQRAEIPDEELQMKADPNSPIQKASIDEEELQMKADPNSPIQKASSDEEELQMKADPNSPRQISLM